MYSSLEYKKLFSGSLFTKQFFALFCFIYFILNYKYLFDYPTGLHFIRQTDSISFIYYYLHKSNFNFFDLGNLSLSFEQGRASCEFPIIYYLCFIIFKIFGVHLEIIRWLSLIVTTISLYYLLVAAYAILKNKYLAIGCVLMVISSSVYRYYSVNFLPDSFALGCVFIGFYQLVRFTKSSEKYSGALLFVFFTLASLLKVYYGIYLISSVLFILFFQKSVFKETIILAVISFSTIILWYVFSIYYNNAHHSNYYLTSALPIWKMSDLEIHKTLNAVVNYWYSKYYLPTIFHVFFVFCLLFLIPIQKNKYKFENGFDALLVFCFTGVIIYCLVFFKQFKDHDYYFLPILPFFMLLSLLALSKISALSPNIMFLTGLILLLGILSVLGFNYTSVNMDRRFSNSINEHSIVGYQLAGISAFNDERHIKTDSKFIVIGDKTLNGSLVFLNRFGWTYPDFNLDLGSVQSNLPLADYLLILEPSAHKIPDALKLKLLKCEKYSYNSNFIYDLKNYRK